MLALLFAAHLLGDFLLQNDWMQSKAHSSFVCGVHVAFYSLGFAALAAFGLLPWLAFWLIIVEHFAQDRFELHVRWMEFYGHTPPDAWPVGRLCVDQSMHLVFIAIVFVLTGGQP